MATVIFGVFLMLHGLVHLLYLGQSQRFFELQPGMTWPDGPGRSRDSWAMAPRGILRAFSWPWPPPD